MKRSVREAALSLQPCNSESSRDSHSDGSSEHFFVPLSETGFSHLDPDINGFLSFTGSNDTFDAQRSTFDFEDAQEVFSPPLLMDSYNLSDPFEDLLGMLSFQTCFCFKSLSFGCSNHPMILKYLTCLKFNSGVNTLE